MAKKILHTIDAVGTRKEFLIPLKKASGIVLIGISSGKEYEKGMVVYTGKELTAEVLVEKAKASKLVVSMDLLNEYLAQIPQFKISKMIAVKSGIELQLEQL